MSRTIYYGKTTKYVGKTLFELLANLRNFGIGRMVYRHTELERTPYSYYIIRHVEPVMDEKLELGVAHAEQIYNGARVPELVTIDEETWHTDWRLVPKDEEHLYRVDEDKMIQIDHPSKVTVLPRWMDVPPLMDIYLRRYFKAKNNVTPDSVKGIVDSNQPLKIRLKYLMEHRQPPKHLVYRVAKEGETPSVPFKTNINTLPHKYRSNINQISQNKV